MSQKRRKPEALDPLWLFGQRVKEIRDEKEMRQSELAEAAQVHVNYVSQVENGHRNISLVNILWFAAALDVDPAQLFTNLGRSELRRLPAKSNSRLRPSREK